MNSAVRQSVKIADEVFRDFVKDVINGPVVNFRRGDWKSHNERKRFEKGETIDTRVIHLLAISGKGGIGHEEYENVTLLDHVLSVTRGAMLLAVMDDVTELADSDIPILKRQLALVAATALLHDMDKDLELVRGQEITVEQVAERMTRYGLTVWLKNYGIPLTPEQMLSLRAMAESSERYRYLANLPREASWAARYVEVADKLDGIWLHKDGGIKGMLEHLRKTTRLSSPLTRQWRVPCIDIYDPHHPFLLDELQQAISRRCSLRLGIPPLIEIHKDGRLLMLLPECGKETDAVIDEGMSHFGGELPSGLNLLIIAEGKKTVPSLTGGQPTLDELRDYLERLNDFELIKTLYLKQEVKPVIEEHLGDVLNHLGLPLKWSEGNYCLPFMDLEYVPPEARRRFYRAALTALLLTLPDKRGPKRQERETSFREALQYQYPEWLGYIKDDQSRRRAAALWSAVSIEDSGHEFERIWGDDGLLTSWWEGEQQDGIRYGLDNQAQSRHQATLDHYRFLLNGTRSLSENEDAKGRCLFTDRPVDFSQTISKEDMLDQVAISAFSGRDHRPEYLGAPRHTNVGPVSIMEYQKRLKARTLGDIEPPKGKATNTPTLVSCPMTAGLFGGFSLSNEGSLDRAITDISLSKLTGISIDNGAIRFNLDHVLRRTRVARFVRIQEKNVDQAGPLRKLLVDQLRELLLVAYRLGRPIHIFRGLPSAQRSFFYFDAMPNFLASLVGGRGLRLEQIPDALVNLELAQTLFNTNGLGLDIVRAFASPAGRFGALCQAWCNPQDRKEPALVNTRTILLKRIRLLLEEGNMTPNDRALVHFAQAAARIQQRFGEGAPNNEQLRVFNKAFEAVINALKQGQSHPESLINAVAGDLERDLGENRYAASKEWREGKSLLDACRETAHIFVHEVWLGALQGHAPPQRAKATLASIYRVALLESYRNRDK